LPLNSPSPFIPGLHPFWTGLNLLVFSLLYALTGIEQVASANLRGVNFLSDVTFV